MTKAAEPLLAAVHVGFLWSVVESLSSSYIGQSSFSKHHGENNPAVEDI